MMIQAIFPLPPLLVDMLTQGCPDLEELILGSLVTGATNSPLYDGMALTHGRWPNLHTLNLEQLHFFDPTSVSMGDAVRREKVAAFFSAHSHSVRTVEVHQEYLLPTEMHLISFRGRSGYNSTSYSGHMYRDIQTLDLSGTPGKGCDVLQLPSIVESLPNIVLLAFSIDLEAPCYVEFPDGIFREFRAFEHIRAVLRSAPKLSSLRLVCRTTFPSTFALVSYIIVSFRVTVRTMGLQAYLPAIFDGSTLKSFQLWRRSLHVWGYDCDITPTAARLALACPSLKFMSFRMICDRGCLQIDGKLEVVRDSAYSVVHSADGEPVQLLVQDRVPDHTRRSRNDRYLLDLRPKVGVFAKWKRALNVEISFGWF